MAKTDFVAKNDEFFFVYVLEISKIGCVTELMTAEYTLGSFSDLKLGGSVEINVFSKYFSSVIRW